MAIRLSVRSLNNMAQRSVGRTGNRDPGTLNDGLLQIIPSAISEQQRQEATDTKPSGILFCSRSAKGGRVGKGSKARSTWKNSIVTNLPKAEKMTVILI